MENSNPDLKAEIIKKRFGVDDPLFANLKTPKAVLKEKWEITKDFDKLPDNAKLP